MFRTLLKNIADDYKYVVPSKTSKDAIRIYEVMNRKRNVAPFRLTAGVGCKKFEPVFKIIRSLLLPLFPISPLSSR